MLLLQNKKVENLKKFGLTHFSDWNPLFDQSGLEIFFSDFSKLKPVLNMRVSLIMINLKLEFPLQHKKVFWVEPILMIAEKKNLDQN